jgi:hypothetical protein
MNIRNFEIELSNIDFGLDGPSQNRDLLGVALIAGSRALALDLKTFPRKVQIGKKNMFF